MTDPLNIRRLVMDVDKAIARPSIPEIAAAINSCDGVESMNITVGEIDLETVGMDIIVEGSHLVYNDIVRSIEKVGAIVHSLDQIVCGNHIIDAVVRSR